MISKYPVQESLKNLKMKIYISGASGFIGKALIRSLSEQGHTVSAIPRKLFSSLPEELASFIQDAEVLINLSGAPVVGKWTKRYKKELYDSRIGITQKLYTAFEKNGHFPKYVLTASAVGIYDEHFVQTEKNHQYANGFLADLVKDWESEAMKFSLNSNAYIMRLGTVLGKEGALKKLLPPFKMGVGTIIGRGKQFMPWIHIHDVVNFVNWILNTEQSTGVYNLVAPERVSNAKFSRKLGKVLHRPVFMRMPGFVLKLIFGKGAQVLLKGQEVIPEKLLNKGFEFKFPKLEEALREVTSNK